jgi:spore germination protein GerM
MSVRARQSVSRSAAAAGLAALALVLGAAPGCGDDGPATTPPPPATVTVWFADDSGALVAESRPAPEGAPLEAAMRALADGPEAAGLVPALPPGTRLLSATVEGGVATVDFSGELEAGYPRGAAAELALVAPVVRTAAQAAGTPRVRILVEGRPPAPPDGQLDLSVPLSPEDVAAGG